MSTARVLEGRSVLPDISIRAHEIRMSARGIQAGASGSQ